jgi:hypothetical protein
MRSVAVRLMAVTLVALLAREARAESSIVLPKPGQIGLGVGGGYGGYVQSGNIAQTFGLGPEFNVRIRYRMRYERAFGLSFESQQLDARVAPPPYNGQDSTIAPTKLSVILSGAEFYQLFGTRTKTTRMVMIGGGLAQMRASLNDGETELSGDNSGDGLYVSAGAGMENFVYRSWAWDLSARYFAVFRDGQANHNFQIALGAIFYASY